MGLRIVQPLIEYLLYTAPHTRVTSLFFFGCAKWLAGQCGVLTTGPVGKSQVTSLNLTSTDR